MTHSELLSRVVGLKPADVKRSRVIKATGFQRNTMLAIERGQDVRLSTFLRYCEAIGVAVIVTPEEIAKEAL